MVVVMGRSLVRRELDGQDDSNDFYIMREKASNRESEDSGSAKVGATEGVRG
jgi:hypothetical protein